LPTIGPGALWIAGAAALASPIGGLIALCLKPTTLFMSWALGFASGVLLATIGFEMVPQALAMSSLAATIVGFAAGFIALYLLDRFINRGILVGPKAAQLKWITPLRKRRRPRGDEVTVLAGGTSIEELIEGLSIGAGAAIEPELGLMIAIAIVVDNLAEALSIGELIRDQAGERKHIPVWRVIKWTGLIGLSLFASATIGWFLLRDMSPAALGALIAGGAGGMFYLTVTDLLPAAEERQFQQSAALAAAAGFVVILALGHA
jgi:ZIP family zinc transporter